MAAFSCCWGPSSLLVALGCFGGLALFSTEFGALGCSGLVWGGLALFSTEFAALGCFGGSGLLFDGMQKQPAPNQPNSNLTATPHPPEQPQSSPRAAQSSPRAARSRPEATQSRPKEIQNSSFLRREFGGEYWLLWAGFGGSGSLFDGIGLLWAALSYFVILL